MIAGRALKSVIESGKVIVFPVPRPPSQAEVVSIAKLSRAERAPEYARIRREGIIRQSVIFCEFSAGFRKRLLRYMLMGIVARVESEQRRAPR
jgi:hypothetical protein